MAAPPQGIPGQLPYPPGVLVSGAEAMTNNSLQQTRVKTTNEASAPPATFDQIGGYENTTGAKPVLVGPPPAYVSPDQPTEVPKETFASSAFLSDEDAKLALVEFAGQNCCYGKSPAADIRVKDLKSSSAYHYSLDSFHEVRETNWHDEPYKGQSLDGPMYGLPPGPWDIYVEPPPLFQDKVSHTEVPHTAAVKPCWECSQRGKIRCKHCHGHGHERCSPCNGEGWTNRAGEREECNFCNGRGKKDCMHCHGHGHITCPKCQGGGQIKTYIQLTVTWKTHKGNHVVERTDLPDELIENVQGDVMFSQQFPKVFPLTSFPEHEINQASQRMVAAHLEELKFSRVLMQRHNLRAVPVTEVQGQWKEKSYRYWVYGKESKVHCPDYPQKCCCGCVIL